MLHIFLVASCIGCICGTFVKLLSQIYMYVFMQASDECGLKAIAYEFVKSALFAYETAITDSLPLQRVASLTAVVATMLNCSHFPTEDYEALITKVAQYCNKLTDKSDQCRMVSLCSLLFWPPMLPGGKAGRYCDCNRALECMQRSIKIASTCDATLYVEILERYCIYYILWIIYFYFSYV